MRDDVAFSVGLKTVEVVKKAANIDVTAEGGFFDIAHVETAQPRTPVIDSQVKPVQRRAQVQRVDGRHDLAIRTAYRNVCLKGHFLARLQTEGALGLKRRFHLCPASIVQMYAHRANRTGQNQRMVVHIDRWTLHGASFWLRIAVVANQLVTGLE